MGFSIDVIPALTDSYIFAISDSDLGLAMVIDPGEAAPVRRAMQERDVHLSLILNTHHHSDHVGGNAALQREYGSPVIAPIKEKNRINGVARGVDDGDTVTFSDLRGTVIGTPGHTVGHVSYYFPQLKALFCGDTLFSLGCGRVFEGTAAQMWASLLALRALPDDTDVYCSHEYTEKNAHFALALDNQNPELRRRFDEVIKLRRVAKPTIPVKLGLEKKLNPFLRADDKAFVASLVRNGFHAQDGDPAAIFGAMRAAKDRFDVSAET